MSRQERWLVAGLAAVLALPLLVAAIAVRRPTWFPVLDLAMTELRVRDVGTSHTPLIGLPGRIGTLAEQGSHPGPLSFYALTPAYRLFGSSAWAMQVGTALLNVAALSLSLWIAARRGGRGLVVAVAALLALLAAGYGIGLLIEPWNPYLPVLWWIVVLLAVWSVIDGDVALLPIAVVAASFCAQTHLPYLGLAGGLGVVVAVALAVQVRRAAPGEDRRRLLRWAAVSVGLGVVLWLPPVLDQVVNDPGNLSLLADHLGTPPEAPVGLRRGVELALVHLDVPYFFRADSGATGSLVDAASDPESSIVPGVAILAAWGVAAAWTVRHRRAEPALLRLHVVVAAALALGVVSMSRIFGKVWYYLMLWAWGTAALLLLALGWTIASALGPRFSPAARARLAGFAMIAGIVGVGVPAFLLTTRALDVAPPAENLSSTLGALLPDTIAALDRGEGEADGRESRYVVTWDDAFYFGSQGYGFLSELERVGFDVRAEYPWRVPATRHRVFDQPSEADASVNLVTGVFVDEWRALPGAVEVAFVEPRTGDERAEFDRLRAAVIDDLETAGLHDIVPIVDENLFGASIDERIDRATQQRMARMLELGQPTAIFIAPPGTHR